MDLVTGARCVIVAMTHTVKGTPKIVRHCALPLTSVRPVSLIVIEVAVIEPTADGPALREQAPGVTVEAIIAATEATLIVLDHVPEIVLPIGLLGQTRWGAKYRFLSKSAR